METPNKTEYSTKQTLYMGMELSQTVWKLGFSKGKGQAPRIREIKASAIEELEREIELAKAKYKIGTEGNIKSCYEAGLDGFWIHRQLEEVGIENVVVDPASVEVNRRAKQRKTDKLDARKLVRHLIRYDEGDTAVWKVVQVPSEEAEESRHLHRQLWNLKNDWTRYRNRIYGILKTHGVALKIKPNFMEEMRAVRLWNGKPLSGEIQRRVSIDYELLQAVSAQIKVLERVRREFIQTAENRALKMVRQLRQLRGVGDNGAWLLVMEFFGWREFKNRREVGGLAGLAPTPYASGNMYREQGISKAGNHWVRGMMIQLAWGWLRFQPDSALTRWWNDKYVHASKAERKKGIVALARKLLVAFWQYLDKGLVPVGAKLKTVQ